MIAEMHGKGIPVELIVSAVATLEEAMAARAVSTGLSTGQSHSPVDTSMMEKRRAFDRNRKRLKREQERLAKLAASSTRQAADVHRTVHRTVT